MNSASTGPEQPLQAHTHPTPSWASTKMIQPQLSPNCLSLWTPSWSPPPPAFLNGSGRVTGRQEAPLQWNAACQAFLGSSKPASILPSASPLCTQTCGSKMFVKFLLQSTPCFGDRWAATLALLPPRWPALVGTAMTLPPLRGATLLSISFSSSRLAEESGKMGRAMPLDGKKPQGGVPEWET